METAEDWKANLTKACEMFKQLEAKECIDEYDLKELIMAGGIYRIHDYETMGQRPKGTYECGSARMADTPKSLYRALYLFRPKRLNLELMYKESVFTLVSPDYELMADIAFFKYELAVYFGATKEHIEGKMRNIIAGVPGSDNGIVIKGEIGKAWSDLLISLLNREWLVYSGNGFVV